LVRAHRNLHSFPTRRSSDLLRSDTHARQGEEMGFLDKAKQLAGQAQEKLDEAQKRFNESQREGGADQPGGPAVEYDKHGRPLDRSEERRVGKGETGGGGQNE